MKWQHFRLSARCAVIFGIASFVVYFFYVFLSQFNLFPPDFMLLSFPGRLSSWLFSWDQLVGWKAYVTSLILAPLYYMFVGFCIGLLVEKFRAHRK
jgi:hypothetical protein